MNTEENLNKIKITANIEQILFDRGEFDINSIINKLKKASKKATIKGFSKIKLITFDVPNDENNLGYSGIQIVGERMETEEEWLRRIEGIKYHKKRTLDNYTRGIGLIETLNNDIKEIEKVIETTTLRCEKCNIPCSYTISISGKKPRRLCSKCADKERRYFIE